MKHDSICPIDRRQGPGLGAALLLTLLAGCADDGDDSAQAATDGATTMDSAIAGDAAAVDGAPPDAAPPTGCTIEWVPAGRVEIFAYEASRTDATDASPGAATDGVCSRAGALPWTQLTLPEAQAACAIAGARLCTDEEWAAACQGDRGWGFPYGDAHAPGTCNDHVSGTGSLQPTGSLPDCRTPEGVFDLSGNVWEFVGDDGRRGASYRVNAAMFRVDAARCDQRYVAFDDFQADDIGFRCCRDLR